MVGQSAWPDADECTTTLPWWERTRHCVNIGVQRSVGSLRQSGTHDLEQRMAPQSIGRGRPTNEFDVGGLITVDTPAAFYPAPQGSVSVPRKHGNTRAVPP